MLRNHLKIAWRNLLRHKVYSLLNVAGLALGVAAFLLLLEYVSHERSVNQFHAGLPNLVRVLNLSAKGDTWPEVEPGWAPLVKQRFPEVNDYCRFADGIAQGVVRTGAGGEAFREKAVGFAEGNFFRFFSFPLTMGRAESLAKPRVVFLSESSARKYFGSRNPLGETLLISNQFGSAPFLVEGVYADMPENSDIRYDLVVSLETLRSPAYIRGNDWVTLDNLDNQYINTLFLLNDGVDRAAFEQKLSAFRRERSRENDGIRFRLQPLAHVHLAESLADTYHHTGNVRYVYTLGVIAFFIVLIAWFNYVNLSTAQALKRANEVGVRKAVGATEWMLVGQFLVESLLVNALAFGLALLLVQALQPLFNELIGKNLSLASLGHPGTWAVGLAVLVLGSLGSGAYTAWRLARYRPVETLKSRLTRTASGVLLRKSLVVAQFAMSIGLVLATLVIFGQLRYMKTKNLGIDTSRLVVVKGPDVGKDSSYANRRSGFENETLAQGFVQGFSASGTVPSGWFNFATEGFTQPASKPGDELKSYSFAIVDHRYLPTYGMKLKAGRNFTPEETNVEWNANSKVLLNEKAVEQLGFETPEQAVRTRIRWDERHLEVVGVVQNYHHSGVQRAIEPIIFYPQNNNANYTLRLTAGNLPERLAALERTYKASFPGNPFEYFFVDDNFNRQYLAEERFGNLFTTAAAWAIAIACLGLFGLASFTVQQRTKEIGVRKILGASAVGIAAMLSKDFLKLVFVALLIASPVGWYAMNRWLADFAYKIEIGWWVFALAGLLAAGVALLTVGFQSVKAALANPVKSLRTE